MAKVYLPENFKNTDAERLRVSMMLAVRGRVTMNFDEKGFWVEVPEEGSDVWEEAIREFFRNSN